MPKRRSGPAILSLVAAALMGVCPPAWLLALSAPAEAAFCPLATGDCAPCTEQQQCPASSGARGACRECCTELTERQQVPRPAAQRVARSVARVAPLPPTLLAVASTRLIDARAESPPLHLLLATFRN